MMMGIGKFGRRTAGASGVLVVTCDDAFARKASAALERDGRYAVRVLADTVSRLSEQGPPAGGAQLLLVELDPLSQQDLAALELFMRQHAPGLRVIVVTEMLAGETARTLLRLQVADWLLKTAPETEILQTCERALDTQTGPGGRAGVHAFFPATGGVGNTALAIQSAFLLGQRRQLGSTCLIDLDFQSGAVADYLDLEPSLQLDELAPDPSRLDEHLLEVMLSRHDSGLAVLAAGGGLRDLGAIDQDTVARLLDLAAARFDRLVLDLPQVWLPWTPGVMLGADKVYIVTELTVPGLRAANRLVGAIERYFDGQVSPAVIVNRYRTSLISGGVNALRRKDAERVLGDRLAGFVTEDYRLVREAIDRGVPLFEVRKRNKIERDLAEILFGQA